MPYTKTIVCLANSRKPGGRCVAGLEIDEDGLGEWIRPVSSRPGEELNFRERHCAAGREVQLLDVVSIRLIQHRPHACQQENHVIDAQHRWDLEGQQHARNLLPFADTEGPLWINGHHSANGINDRIPLQVADALSSSLRLIAAKDMAFCVVPGKTKRQLRLAFKLGRTRYSLAVTDPGLEAEYLRRELGEYPESRDAIACISLGEPYEDFRYKLAASVIFID